MAVVCCQLAVPTLLPISITDTLTKKAV